MGARDEHGRLVEAIYEAASDPSRWPATVARIGRALGGEAAGIGELAFDPPSPRFAFFWNLDDPAGWQAFLDRHLTNPWMEAGFRLPLGEVSRSEPFISTRRLLQTPFFDECLRPWRVAHSLGAMLERGPGSVTLFNVYRWTRRGPFGESAVRRAGLLAPHLRRAFAIHAQLEAANLQRDGALEALDQLPRGVILVGTRGEALFANRAAEQTGIGLDASEELRAAVHQAIAIAQGGVAPPPDAVSLPRTRAGRARCALVAPLRGHGLRSRRAAVAAAILLPETEIDEAQLVRTLRACGLTRGEAEVAGRVGRGDSLAAVCDALGMSRNTASSHLKAAFVKLGVHRQAELVRLVAGLTISPRR